MTSRYPGGLVRKNAANTAITGASGVWDLGSQAQAVKNNTWPISGLANPVSGSLRFRSSASAYLNRTFTQSGDTQKFTQSVWCKRGTLGAYQTIGYTFFTGTYNGQMRFNSNDTLDIYVYYDGSSYTGQLSTTQVFRDPSAWYHLVLAVDTTQATAANRIKFYVNGVQVTAFGTANYPNPNQALLWNASGNTGYFINAQQGSVYFFDGYTTELNYIDGQALTPSYFGQTSAITGVWEPIKYTGTYGTNGFYLSLSDTSSIGKDFSGNGNNWTPNNISTTSGSTFDLMRDVPTQYIPQGATDVGGVVRGNYATLNPLDFTTVGTISEGNLKFTQGTSGAKSGRATFGVSSGKWYWEYTHLGGNSSPGIGNASMTLDYYCGGNANGWSYFVGGAKYNNDVGTNYGAAYTTNDVIGIALDMDAGTLVFYKNGASQGTAFSSLTGTMFPAFSSSSQSNVTFIANFGQRPFAYTPPSGFKSLCTTNLPTPTIGATAATAANKHFDATLITGTAATQVITNAGGFQPDFVWLKSRTNANNPTIYDAIRGVNTLLYPALTNAEAVGSDQLTAFNSNGFTLGASENANDSNGEASVGWQWNAGGSTVTNTSGTISSQVRANPTAGFSIVTYTGNGTSGATVGHGLGVAPSMYIVKVRSTTESWITYHTSIGATNYLALNLTQASSAATAAWNNTAPTSTVFSLGNAGSTNGSGSTFVAYCFAPIAGYSAFGSYTGNGSTDGPFVYTGFRPRFIMIKCSTNTFGWVILDSSRNTYNPEDLYLYANVSDAEGTYTIADFLSNGFKIRAGSATATNNSGDTFIYMAFAENPFKNSLAR